MKKSFLTILEQKELGGGLSPPHLFEEKVPFLEKTSLK